MRSSIGLLTVLAIAAVATAQITQPRVSLAVGGTAPDFALTSLRGGKVRLADELRRGPVVLVLLRGWPGYQCPFCTRQFADYLAHAADLQKAGARVVFVYPGPADGLEAHAEAFARNRDLPAHFAFVIDSDYTFAVAYGLRWDAPGETVYPATLIVNRTGTIRFAQVSKDHGSRVPVSDVLKALSGLSSSHGARTPA